MAFFKIKPDNNSVVQIYYDLNTLTDGSVAATVNCISAFCTYEPLQEIHLYEIKEFVLPSKIPGVETDSIILGDGVASLIGGNCSFNKFVISNGITSISKAAFQMCNKIKTIVIPPSIKEIPERCFKGCRIENVIFSGENNIETVGESAFENSYIGGMFSWPSRCRIIPKSCFASSYLHKIDGLEHVEEVGECAFVFTRALETIHWPLNCKVVPKSCFAYSMLKEVTGMENVEEIQEDAFGGCPNLRSFAWPHKCKRIPDRCFCSSGLSEISGISEVNFIGEAAFWCTEFKKFVWPSQCPVIPRRCFFNCPRVRVSICFDTDDCCINLSAFDSKNNIQGIIDTSKCCDVQVVMNNDRAEMNEEMIKKIKVTFDTCFVFDT